MTFKVLTAVSLPVIGVVALGVATPAKTADPATLDCVAQYGLRSARRWNSPPPG